MNRRDFVVLGGSFAVVGSSSALGAETRGQIEASFEDEGLAKAILSNDTGELAARLKQVIQRISVGELGEAKGDHEALARFIEEHEEEFDQSVRATSEEIVSDGEEALKKKRPRRKFSISITIGFKPPSLGLKLTWT